MILWAGSSSPPVGRLEFLFDATLAMLYASCMNYSSDFATTLATIAAKASLRWQYLGPERSVEFAWFSVNTAGDASIDDADLVRHFEAWLDANGFDLPAWMI